MRIRIVTLNAGLLSLAGGRVQPVPFIEERLTALPVQLMRLDADVIALQEVYLQKHQEFMLAKLRHVYPFAAYTQRLRNRVLGNGLMVLSKYRLADCSFHMFRDASLTEKLLGSKGVLLCSIDLGTRLYPAGILTLVNFHTTAGGIFLHTEALKANQIRARQVDQMLAVAQAGTGVTLLAGDLNAGPGVSEGNFHQILGAGYESVHDLLPGAQEGYTWDPDNLLNKEGPHSTSPPQRIDHVFLRRSDLQAGFVQPVRSVICCREAGILTPQGEKVTVSDHYGLQVDLECSG